MDIKVAELKQKLENKEDILLIDVREDYEHCDFNLGGRLIPIGELISNSEELLEFKDKEIIVYCRSGVRSATAQAYLQSLGCTNVRNLIGGVLAWHRIFGWDLVSKA